MAYDKVRRSGSILTREENPNYSRWRLKEGPNDIRMTVQQYLSRYKYQVQLKKFPGHEEQSRFCIIYLSRIPRQLYFRTFTRGGFPGDEDKFHRGQLLLWIKILP